MRGTILVSLLLLLSAAAVAACGSASKTISGPTLTASQYRARANAICTKAASRVTSLARPRSYHEVRHYLRRTLAALRPAAARLRALRPPPRLAARASRAAVILGGEVYLVRRMSWRIAHGGDARQAARFASPQVAYMKRRALRHWRAVRATKCSVRMGPAMARPVAVMRRAPLPVVEAHFRSAGNAICARMNEFSRALAPATHGRSGSAVLKAAEAILANEERALAELRALQPPRQGRARFRKLLADTGKLLAAARSAFAALESHDPVIRAEGANAVVDLLARGVEINRRFAVYGLATCSK